MDTIHDEENLANKPHNKSLKRFRRLFRFLTLNPRSHDTTLASQKSPECSASERPPLGITLIVEESGWKSEALISLLCASGQDVRVVQDPASALEAVQHESPRLIIVSGAADLSLYRALRDASSAPILALVPESDRDQVLAAFAAGVDDYQAGPISNLQIAARAQALLRHSKQVLLSAESA